MTRLDYGVLAVLGLDDPAQRLSTSRRSPNPVGKLVAHATTVRVQGAPLLPVNVWGDRR